MFEKASFFQLNEARNTAEQVETLYQRFKKYLFQYMIRVFIVIHSLHS